MVPPVSGLASAWPVLVERCPLVSFRKLAVPALILLAAGGCSRTGDIAEGGITAVRSACPRVAIPAGTGDVTLFNPATSRDASAIDVVAAMTNVQSTCNDATDPIVTNVTFDVLARRNAPGPARDVTLPYFITVVRAGTSVVAKRVHNVTVHFNEGQVRAQVSGQATASVGRAAATLSEEARKRLAAKRKAGEEAAAMDPLADPAVRSAVLSATFEALVGFQLTEDQLKYNATR
jgi:hypothetical protein